MEWPHPTPNLVGVLQRHVLSKISLQVVSPGDCKQISRHLEGQTGKLISETTLKRFFGFAHQQYNFSRFTLNTLCEFAGFSGWEHFCKTVADTGGLASERTMWEEFRQEALQVTESTLTSVRNLSGVPFHVTVSRSAIERDFAYFLNSDCQFFCLSGVAGIGKSIQMAHLVHRFFLDQKAPFGEGIVWFVKCPTLKRLEPREFSFAEFTRDQFEIGKNGTFLNYFKTHPHEVKGKLVLLLDGFDEHAFKASELEHIFQKVLELLCYAQGCEWLKVVVSVRTATWLHLQKMINESQYLKKTWFSGMYYQKDAGVNLTALTGAEVGEALEAVRQETLATVDISEDTELYALLENPVFLHLYYQLVSKNPDTSLRGNALYCELVASYAFQKIYRSTYSVEKVRIIQRLIQATDYGRSQAPVERRVLFEANDMYVLAYNDLLNEGILQEKNVDSLFNYRIFVHFQHPAVFAYFIAQELIAKFRSFSGLQLFSKITAEYAEERLRNLILQWVVLHVMTHVPVELSDVVFHPDLHPGETARLIVFITELIEKDPSLLGEPSRDEFIERSVHFLAAHFLELNHIGPEQQAAIRTLLLYVNDSIQEANLRILQGTVAIVLMDKKELSRAIESLRNLDRDMLIGSYPLHPVRAMEFIFRFYSLEPLGEFFDEDICNFIEYPPEPPGNEKLRAASLLSYQLGIFATMFGRCPRQSIAFADIIRYQHPELFSADQCRGVTMYVLMQQAFAYVRCQMKPQARKTLGQLCGCRQQPASEGYYAHSTGLYEILQGEVALGEGSLKRAAGHFLAAYKFARHAGFIMLEIYSALPLLQVYKAQHDFDGVARIMEELKTVIGRIDFPLERLLLNKIMKQA